MRWTIDNSSLPGFLTVTTEGPPLINDVTALWNELLTSDHWRLGMCVLFDNRKMDRFPSDGTGSELISEALNFFQSCIERIGDSRIAVLIAKRENFVYHRQFQYGLSLRGMSANTQIFFNEKDATEWLANCFRTTAA